MAEFWGVLGIIAMGFVGWILKKSYKGEYEKGKRDERTEREAAYRELGEKLNSDPNNHFPVRVRGAWDKTRKTNP